jgi:CheY-like chemotaxis protein
MMQPAQSNPPIAVLVAEDSELDRMLLREAFEELSFDVDLSFVGDGEELFDYLRKRNAYADDKAIPMPALILMDLNMPRMKGLDALKELRADAILRALPVIILTTSSSPKQIAQAFASGVNAYMTKPEQFTALLAMLQKFGDFWLRSSKLPDPHALT